MLLRLNFIFKNTDLFQILKKAALDPEIPVMWKCVPLPSLKYFQTHPGDLLFFFIGEILAGWIDFHQCLYNF